MRPAAPDHHDLDHPLEPTSLVPLSGTLSSGHPYLYLVAGWLRSWRRGRKWRAQRAGVVMHIVEIPTPQGAEAIATQHAAVGLLFACSAKREKLLLVLNRISCSAN